MPARAALSPDAFACRAFLAREVLDEMKQAGQARVGPIC
jgi:hypothetical protein